MIPRYKRPFDLALAAILIPPGIVAGAFLFLLLLLFQGRPVLYTQTRLGLRSKPFTLYKFRTMINGAEANGPQLSTNGDPRVTLMGRIIRSTGLDELPQIWNIIKGDMSWVGPRPERPELYKDYPKSYIKRMEARPGLAGLAQALGCNSTTEKLMSDLLYIRECSWHGDIWIILECSIKGVRGKW